MKLPVRFKVRTLLAIVALVAITLGGSIEWRNRRGRDRCLEREARLLKQIGWHQRQAIYCRRAEAWGHSYSDQDRLDLIVQNVTTVMSLKLSITDWDTEARFHESYVLWLGDRAKRTTEEKLAYQRRLLFP